MITKREFYINGEWISPHSPKVHAVIDPSTEEPCAFVSLGGQMDTDRAVAAARTAFPAWMLTPPAERIAYVEKILDLYMSRSEELAQAMSLEMGAALKMSREQQVESGTWHISNFLKAARAFKFEEPLRPDTPDERLIYDPVGVIAMITPWNWPMNQITLKVIAGILAGCTMVLKPSEESPLSAIIFAEIIDAVGLPKGVFNLVNGDGAGVGSQLTAHPDVDMISFTGSTRAGRLISRAAADGLKRVSLELGGKGANLIFADADRRAVQSGVLRCMNNAGQSCSAPTRMLVQREIYEHAVEEAARVAKAIKVRPATEDGDHIGPVVNAAQFNRIQGLIQKGIDEGARLVAGGTGRPDGLNRGFFVKPTVFADVSNEMTIAQEEIFGPVLSIIPFDSEEDGIRIANDTAYGLTNYVQTSDPARANRIARAIRSGQVEINGRSHSEGAPFGGIRQSGHGREGGRWGIEDFLEIKAVAGWTPDA